VAAARELAVAFTRRNVASAAVVRSTVARVDHGSSGEPKAAPGCSLGLGRIAEPGCIANGRDTRRRGQSARRCAILVWCSKSLGEIEEPILNSRDWNLGSTHVSKIALPWTVSVVGATALDAGAITRSGHA
jgi:hypothetical protein